MTSTPTPGNPPPQAEPTPGTPADTTPSSSFFRRLRGLDLARSEDRWMGGVAGGLARRSGLDLALVRGLIVVLAIFGGIGVLLYGLAWALLPEPDGRIHVEEAGRGSWTSGLTGAAALVVLGLLQPNLTLFGDGGTGGVLWALFWIGAVGLFVHWITHRPNARPPVTSPAGDPPWAGSTPTADRPPARAADERAVDGRTGPITRTEPTIKLPYRPASATTGLPLPSDPAPQPYAPLGSRWSPIDYPPPAAPTPVRSTPASTRRRATRPSGATTAVCLGAALLVAGVLLALDLTLVLDFGEPLVVALAPSAVALAVGVIALGAAGRSSGFVGFAAAITTIGALLASSSVAGGSFMVAQQTEERPSAPRIAERGYSALAAVATIDLTDLSPPTEEIIVPVNTLVSDVTVVVPEDVPVEVRTRMALGSADAGGAGPDGSAGETTSEGGVLQIGTQDLNRGAEGPAIVLDVRGALSNVSVITTAGDLR